MRKFITVVFLTFLARGHSALAQSEIKLQENAPDRYVVEKGDTLWGISAKFLKEPWRWPELWRMNQEQIKNPDRIYPGNVIVLDRRTTPPQLSLGETVKLSAQIRAEPLPDQSISSIPAQEIEPFLSRPLVIESGGLDKAPRIVGTQESHVNLGSGSLAYVSGMGDAAAQVWQIFRQGRPLVDPDTNLALGYEAVFLGTARVSRSGEPATVQIVTSTQEIGPGDRLIPAGAPVINQYIPHSPSKLIKGRIISIYGGLATSEGGRDSIVAISKGRRDGLENGHVLAISRAGSSIPDPQAGVSRDRAPTIKLPDERYGLLFVFRTFDAVAYALVMESSGPVQPGDVIQSP